MLMVLLGLAACVHVPEPTADFRLLSEPPPSMRIVLFPPSCTQDDGVCEDVDLSSLNALLRTELEFDGHTIVDGVTLVNQARSRAEQDIALTRFGEQLAGLSSVAQQGSLFDDLPPAARRALLTEARADAVLRSTVAFGPVDPNSGVSRYRQITVQTRLGLGEDEAPAWVARCARTGAKINNVNSQGVENYDLTLAALGGCVIEQARSQ